VPRGDITAWEPRAASVINPPARQFIVAKVMRLGAGRALRRPWDCAGFGFGISARASGNIVKVHAPTRAIKSYSRFVFILFVWRETVQRASEQGRGKIAWMQAINLSALFL